MVYKGAISINRIRYLLEGMRILIAEDEYPIALSYKRALEKNKHDVLLTPNGEECIKTYTVHYLTQLSQTNRSRTSSSSEPSAQQQQQQQQLPVFDAIILDYKMPKKNGMEVAKEILDFNPHERIIFASAYVKETLVDSVKDLKRIVELMQKPFDAQALIDTVEDKSIYESLDALNINVKKIKDLEPTHGQISELLEGLRDIMKGRTF